MICATDKTKHMVLFLFSIISTHAWQLRTVREDKIDHL